MAKFTVYFKDKFLLSKIFEQGEVHIGRDSSNHIIIDNLAVAEKHAIITIKENQFTIKQLNELFPLVVNANKITELKLSFGDKISMGKHRIEFDAAPVSFTETALSSEKKEVKINANLQILKGQYIGRILPLKSLMTRFKHNNGKEIVIISKRKIGFTISSLEGNSTAIVNNKELGNNQIHLKNNDTIVINNTAMKFILDK